MKTVEHVIQDTLGIHARPAGLLIKEAGRFTCDIRIAKGEKSADAKKIFGVMGLAAKCGDVVTVTCEGEDEEAAAQAMEQFLKNHL